VIERREAAGDGATERIGLIATELVRSGQWRLRRQASGRCRHDQWRPRDGDDMG